MCVCVFCTLQRCLRAVAGRAQGREVCLDRLGRLGCLGCLADGGGGPAASAAQASSKPARARPRASRRKLASSVPRGSDSEGPTRFPASAARASPRSKRKVLEELGAETVSGSERPVPFDRLAPFPAAHRPRLVGLRHHGPADGAPLRTPALSCLPDLVPCRAAPCPARLRCAR